MSRSYAPRREPIEHIDLVRLRSTDLIVDTVYGGGVDGNTSDDPIHTAPAGRQFRRHTVQRMRFWPRIVGFVHFWRRSRLAGFNRIPKPGTLAYFGDNKRGGRELHDTPRGGNELLRKTVPCRRRTGLFLTANFVPPILVFGGTGERRNHRFLGLAVPGAPGVAAVDELVGIWRSSAGIRYRNYRALFTILDAGD